MTLFFKDKTKKVILDFLSRASSPLCHLTIKRNEAEKNESYQVLGPDILESLSWN